MPRPYPDSAKRKNFCGGGDFQKAQVFEVSRLLDQTTERPLGVRAPRIEQDPVSLGFTVSVDPFAD
ncbi:MAG: hypothetical protein IID48_20925 [Proteobacteria bacterium]|nr:hypothetical protein [Pseudomonadota bacterium]